MNVTTKETDSEPLLDVLLSTLKENGIDLDLIEFVDVTSVQPASK